MPSGGLFVRARYSWRRRRWAVVDAIVFIFVGRWRGGEVVRGVRLEVSFEFVGCSVAAVDSPHFLSKASSPQLTVFIETSSSSVFTTFVLSQLKMSSTKSPLRVGYVPEHFSTPLFFAQKHFGLTTELIPFLSGTGHMITSLRSGEIDVGIGLTEGWVAGLGKNDIEGDGGYKIVGTYVETPLCMTSAPLRNLSTE